MMSWKKSSDTLQTRWQANASFSVCGKHTHQTPELVMMHC